jgi:hypothetical protein
LGIIYTNIPTFGPHREWVPAGRRIDASQFTSCNLAPFIGVTGWSDIVQFWPTTDTDKTAGVLEIFDFKGNRWVEYQVNLPETKNYTLTVRYRTSQNTTASPPANIPAANSTNLRITVDGGTPRNTTLNSAAWTTASVDLGNLPAGNRTIRLQVTSGNCALNWLRID